MLDRFSIKVIRWPLTQSAQVLNHYGVTANQITVLGFVLGCFALPALMAEQYLLALAFIVLNRVCDGLDGALARLKGSPTQVVFSTSAWTFSSTRSFLLVLSWPTQNKTPLLARF